MKNIYKERYTLLKDAYDGGGGFADGTYLQKHPREDATKFKARQEMAYYLNYMQPCVDAHVSPIFKTPAIREVDGAGAEAWRAFMDNADMAGSSIKKLMNRAATLAKLHGVAFIVMDRAHEDAPPTTLAALAENRAAAPYAFVVEPARVDEVTLDQYGRIATFRYKEPDPKEEGKKATRLLTAEGWTLTTADGETQGDKWDLGTVPVIPLYAVDHDPLNPFPTPGFLSIAKAEKAIYNRCSWLDDILINQTFSILTYPDNQSTNSLVIGTNNAVGYPADASHAPAFIAPAIDPANVLRESIADLQRECYRMATVVNVTGVREQTSGVAKAWDFEQTNQLLTDYADTLEETEEKLAELFKRWTGLQFEYNVNYPNDYSISDVETELANAEVAKGLGFGDAFNLEVYKRILSKYLPELKGDEIETMVAEYQKAQELQRLDYSHDLDSDEV